MCVATPDLPRSAAHPFHARLNQILDEHDLTASSRDCARGSTRTRGTPGSPFIPQKYRTANHTRALLRQSTHG